MFVELPVVNFVTAIAWPSRTLSRVLTVLIFAAAFSATACGQEMQRFIDVQQAIGMPGSLGIAGLDAMTEFCTRKRDSEFRNALVALVETNVSGAHKKRLIEFYDKRFADWRGAYRNKPQTAESRAKVCGDDNLQRVKDPDRSMWARMAKKIGFPGF